jgi:predicted phosphodiesterase
MDNDTRADEVPRVKARAGVIGDIHTEFEALAWALSVLNEQKVELVLATGDVSDGPCHGEGVNRACEILREASVITVLGNHDRWMLDNTMRDFPNATEIDEIDKDALAYLRSLPATREVDTPHGRLLLCHGLGRDDMATLYPHDRGPQLSNNVALQRLLKAGRFRYVVGGHTHRRMVRTIEDVTFVNAGAIKETREPCCLVLDFEAGVAQFHDFVKGKTVEGPKFEL